MDMNRKEFIKKVGIETDEDHKVVCPWLELQIKTT